MTGAPSIFDGIPHQIQMKAFPVLVFAQLLVIHLRSAEVNSAMFRVDFQSNTEDVFYHGVRWVVERSYVPTRIKPYLTKTTVQTVNGPVVILDSSPYPFNCVTQTYETYEWESLGGPLVYHGIGNARTFLYVNYSDPQYSRGQCALRAAQYSLSAWVRDQYSTSSLTNINIPVTRNLVYPPPQSIWTWESLMIEFTSPFQNFSPPPSVGPIRG